jgi:hypothetical protein
MIKSAIVWNIETMDCEKPLENPLFLPIFPQEIRLFLFIAIFVWEY